MAPAAGRVGSRSLLINTNIIPGSPGGDHPERAVVRRPPDEFPTALLGVALGAGAAAEPVCGPARPRRRPRRLRRALDWGLRLVLLLGLRGGDGHGAAAISDSLVATLFHYERILGPGCAANAAGRDFYSTGRPACWRVKMQRPASTPGRTSASPVKSPSACWC